MSLRGIGTGKKGERLALLHLRKEGYKIIETNYNSRHGEIDIISSDRDCISFVEVRSKSTEGFGLPEYTINRRKKNQIQRAALSYIKTKNLEDRDCRFDVVCIEDINGRSPRIRLIKDAFELDTWYRY
jgi:putative endonuclease